MSKKGKDRYAALMLTCLVLLSWAVVNAVMGYEVSVYRMTVVFALLLANLGFWRAGDPNFNGEE